MNVGAPGQSGSPPYNKPITVYPGSAGKNWISRNNNNLTRL